MYAQADIIVRSTDSTEVTLVVETKLMESELPAAERQLKSYMLQARCPLGLVVTPETLQIYLDRFTSDSEESIEQVGKFRVEELFGAEFRRPKAQVGRTLDHSLSKQGDAVGARAEAFEEAVQGWLEGLSRDGESRISDPRLRETVRRHILPAIETGIIRAAGPRQYSKRI